MSVLQECPFLYHDRNNISETRTEFEDSQSDHSDDFSFVEIEDETKQCIVPETDKSTSSGEAREIDGRSNHSDTSSKQTVSFSGEEFCIL